MKTASSQNNAGVQSNDIDTTCKTDYYNDNNKNKSNTDAADNDLNKKDLNQNNLYNNINLNNKDGKKNDKKEEKQKFDNPKSLFEELERKNIHILLMHLKYKYNIKNEEEQNSIIRNVLFDAYVRFGEYNPAMNFNTWVMTHFVGNRMREFYNHKKKNIRASDMKEDRANSEYWLLDKDNKQTMGELSYQCNWTSETEWTIRRLLPLLNWRIETEMLECGEAHKALAHFSRKRLERFYKKGGVEELRKEHEGEPLEHVSKNVRDEYLSQSDIDIDSIHHNGITDIFDRFDLGLEKPVQAHMDARNSHKHKFDKTLLSTPAGKTAFPQYYQDQLPQQAISNWVSDVKKKADKKWLQHYLALRFSTVKSSAGEKKKEKRNIQKNKGDMK